MSVEQYCLWQHIPIFYYKTFAGILRRHRLQLPAEPIGFAVNYRFSRKQQQRWFDLYGIGADETANVPFCYSAPFYVLRYCDVFTRLGISYRHVLHLRTEMQYLKPGNWVKPGEEARVRIELEDLAYTSGHRVAVVIASTVDNAAGETLLKSRDFLFANCVADAAIAQLKQSRRFSQTQYDGIQRISKRESKLHQSAAKSEPFVIPKDMGRRYGVVSGDFNPIHTSRLLMRCFGYKRLFIQGMCAWNWVAKTLTLVMAKPLADMTMSYCNPMYVGQSIRLLYSGEDFELVDEAGKLLAFGSYRLF